jgi:hypothetical protein
MNLGAVALRWGNWPDEVEAEAFGGSKVEADNKKRMVQFSPATRRDRANFHDFVITRR